MHHELESVPLQGWQTMDQSTMGKLSKIPTIFIMIPAMAASVKGLIGETRPFSTPLRPPHQTSSDQFGPNLWPPRLQIGQINQGSTPGI